MTNSALDFLDEDTTVKTPAASTAVEKAAPAATVKTEGTQETGAAAASTESTSETGDPLVPTPGAGQGFVPIQTVLAERDKRQALETANAALQKRLDRLEAQSRQAKPAPKTEAIDPLVEPEKYAEQMQQNSQALVVRERFNMSKMIHSSTAEGAAALTVAEKAFEDAAEENPHLLGLLYNAPDPYKYILDWHKRESVLAAVGTDLSAYEKKVIEKHLATEAAKTAAASAAAGLDPDAAAAVVTEPVAPAAATPAKPKLPASIVAAPGSGGTADVAESGFAKAFKD